MFVGGMICIQRVAEKTRSQDVVDIVVIMLVMECSWWRMKPGEKNYALEVGLGSIRLHNSRGKPESFVQFNPHAVE